MMQVSNMTDDNQFVLKKADIIFCLLQKIHDIFYEPGCSAYGIP